MDKIQQITIALSILMTWACNNPQNVNGETKQNASQKTEIVTKTFSIKLEGDKVKKDTINMIQSMIVYDDGQEIANRYYNLDGSVSWTDEYDYDGNGNKTGSRYFEGEGNQTAYYEYDLDSLGRRIAYRAKDVNTDTLLYDGASQYLDNGKIRRDGYFNKTGEFKYNFEYQFDEDGKEIGYIYIDLGSGDKYPSKYRYTKFNEKGEWLEREIVETEQVSSIEVREFKALK
ncbi:MAG: hypothetical protein HKN09_01365 [Saprospiraceae bacterium]|nr:hypothetical protein [Saprospiraceae bacterium]